MESKAARKAIRERLILAGIEEISRNGPQGFSMRQTAVACNISCATPYNYFKNKECFINEIKSYIVSQWSLLRTEIVKAYPDSGTRPAELAVGFVKFLTGNPNFRAVLLTGTGLENESSIRGFMDDETDVCIADGDERDIKKFIIRAAVYEFALMIEQGELENSDATYDRIREFVKDTLRNR